MDLQEIGAFLRQEREARGLSIDDIASKIKLASRVIKAIEDGQINDLPHPVYARGFIKSYAELLGVSRESIPEMLLESFPIAPEDEIPEPGPVYRVSAESERNSGRILTFFAIFLVCTLLVGGSWLLISSYGESSLDGIKNLYNSTFSSSTEQSQVQASSSDPAQPQQGSGASLGSASSGAADGREAVNALAPNNTEVASTQESAMPVIEELEQNIVHVLEIVARRNTTIEFSADNADARSFGLNKNQSTRLEFRQGLKVKLFHPNSVKLKYDDADYSFDPPVSGGSKTLTFPPVDTNR